MSQAAVAIPPPVISGTINAEIFVPFTGKVALLAFASIHVMKDLSLNIGEIHNYMQTCMPAMCRKQISGVKTHTEVRFVTMEMPCVEPVAKQTDLIAQEVAVSVKTTVQTDGKKTSNIILMFAKMKPQVCIVWFIGEAAAIWPMEPGVAEIAL